MDFDVRFPYHVDSPRLAAGNDDRPKQTPNLVLVKKQHRQIASDEIARRDTEERTRFRRRVQDSTAVVRFNEAVDQGLL
jgi:hypothetical protein